MSPWKAELCCDVVARSLNWLWPGYLPRGKLVILDGDPLMAFLPPRVAANLDQCVRLALPPLADLAARTGCTILFLRHLTKLLCGRAVRRGQGSMGILAAVRTALFVAPRPGDPTGRVL